MKAAGFKRGEYHIENEIRRKYNVMKCRGGGYEYGHCHIHLTWRVREEDVTEEQIEILKQHEIKPIYFEDKLLFFKYR